MPGQFPVKDWQNSPSTATPLSEAAIEDMETRLSGYSDKVAPEFWVDSYPGANDDAKVAAAATAAAAVKGAVRFAPREYSCGTLWVFDGCFPLGSGGGTKITATAAGSGIRIGKANGAAPLNTDFQPHCGQFQFNGAGLANGSGNSGYAVLTNASGFTYTGITIDHLDPNADGFGIQGQNNLFLGCRSAAGGPGFAIVFDYGTGGNTWLGGGSTGGNLIDFRQSGTSPAGAAYPQPQNNQIENIISDYRPGVANLATGNYLIRHRAGLWNCIRNPNLYHIDAPALIKFEKNTNYGGPDVGNGNLFLEGLGQWLGGGAGKAQRWIDIDNVTTGTAGPLTGADRALDIAGQHSISATENGCIRCGTSTQVHFSFASIMRYNLSATGAFWTTNGTGAQGGPVGTLKDGRATGFGVLPSINGGVGIDMGDWPIQFTERGSDPTAPPANKAVMFAKDNGSGKTGIYVRFPTGATVGPIAVEP